MQPTELIVDAFDRIPGIVHRVVEGLSPDQLDFRPAPTANSIAWLIWHLTRIQDDHIAGAAGTQQIWTADGWSQRFRLPFDDRATGFGQPPEEVAALHVHSGDLLLGYHDAVYRRTIEFVRGLNDHDFDRVVDVSFDPPVTLGVRLVSIICDDLQHAGQGAYVRGILERTRSPQK